MEDKDLVQLFMTQDQLITKRLDDHADKVDGMIRSLPCLEHGNKIVALLTKDDERVKNTARKLTMFGILIAFVSSVLTKAIGYFIEK